MAQVAAKRLAFDANFPLDLAQGKDFAHKLLEALHLLGHQLYLPPTATIELKLVAREFNHPSKEFALKALQCLTAWGVFPFDLKSVGHGITDLFARTLITRGLLPDEEFDDGLILAEASFMDVSALVTSDKHLTEIDETTLRLVFQERDMHPVPVISPSMMVNALKRFKRC